MKEITLGDDVLDSRDIIARIEELEGERRDLLDAGTTWEQYQMDSEAGRCSGSLFMAGDEIFWYGD